MLQTIIGFLILALIFLAIVDVILFIIFKLKKHHIQRSEDKFNERLKETKKLHDAASMKYDQKNGET